MGLYTLELQDPCMSLGSPWPRYDSGLTGPKGGRDRPKRDDAGGILGLPAWAPGVWRSWSLVGSDCWESPPGHLPPPPCFPGGTVIKNLPTNAGGARDTGLIPGLGRSPREGKGYPLQYSCLENSVDRGVWQVTVMRLWKVRHEWAHTLHVKGKIGHLNNFMRIVHIVVQPSPLSFSRTLPSSQTQPCSLKH